MKQIDVTLGAELDAFVDKMIEAGRFRDPSEVIAAGLELLQKAQTPDHAE